MIYLASPYSAPTEALEKLRFQQTRDFVAKQIKLGYVIFSPIVYCHQFKIDFGFAGDADYWAEFNLAILHRAKQMWVLQLTGWEQSRGVQTELAWAKALDIPVIHRRPE